MKLIVTENLSKIFGEGDAQVKALNNISLSIEQGSFVAITGRSGSGKSTLLHQIGLLDYPTSGNVSFADINTNELGNDERTELRLSSMGYIFQDYALLPTLTALENVMLPLLMQGVSAIDSTKLAKEALTRLDLKSKFSNLPSQLSGGQQQRVSIARAISHKPKVIFADEPTANLDSHTAKIVLDAFSEIHKAGQTVVMVTHEKEYTGIANRVIELSDGKIVN